MRAYRAAWLIVCSATALLGAALAFNWTVPAMLTLFSCAGVGGGAATVAMTQAPTDVKSPWKDTMRLVTANALLTGTAAVAIVGLGTLFGPWTWLIPGLLACTSPYVVRRCGQHVTHRLGSVRTAGVERQHDAHQQPSDLGRTSVSAHPARQPSSDDMEAPPAPAQSVETSTLSDIELCRAWRASYVALQRVPSPSQRLRIVNTRLVYLDEIERRNPDGLAAWLASGARAAGDPSKFIIGSSRTGRASIDWDRFLHGLDR